MTAPIVDPSPPELSIVVPTFERPELLARALGSVTDQAGDLAPKIELLISDNSPDVSRPVAEDYLARWPGPIRYLPNDPSIGAIPNFNQCLANATGRYVLMLHDDDYLLPGALAAILETLDRRGGDRAILFGVDVVDDHARRRRRQAFRSEERLSPKRALLRLLANSSFVRIPSVVIRRDVFDVVGRFDETVGNPTDFELLVRVFSRYGVWCQTATVAAYSVHAAAATSEMFHGETIGTVMTIFDGVRRAQVLPDDVLRRCQADWFHHFILGGAYRQLRAGEPRRARTVLDLFDLPEVVALGPSNRWRPIRWLFETIVRLPPEVAASLMRAIGRASPERFWLSW